MKAQNNPMNSEIQPKKPTFEEVYKKIHGKSSGSKPSYAEV